MSKQLYKVTKIVYRRPFDYRNLTAHGDYEVYKKRVDYRTAKGAVTLAFKYAAEQNAAAARMNAQRSDSNPWKYEVQVEVCDLPDFSPACYCDEHGVQPMLNVPGLTTELTCLECI